MKNSDINNNVLGKICGDLNTVNSAGKLNPPKANMSIFVTSLFICPGGTGNGNTTKKCFNKDERNLNISFTKRERGKEEGGAPK